MTIKIYLYLYDILKELAVLFAIMLILTLTCQTPAEFIIHISGFLYAFAAVRIFKKRVFLRAVLGYACLLVSPWLYSLAVQYVEYSVVPVIAYLIVAVVLHTYSVIRDCSRSIKSLSNTEGYMKAEEATMKAQKSLRNLTDAIINLLKSVIDSILK